jgi:hypothetical protein
METLITRKQKQIIRRFVEKTYEYINGRDVRCHADGRVSVHVDAMPNTNQPGRIFAGWDTYLLLASGK